MFKNNNKNDVCFVFTHALAPTWIPGYVFEKTVPVGSSARSAAAFDARRKSAAWTDSPPAFRNSHGGSHVALQLMMLSFQT